MQQQQQQQQRRLQRRLGEWGNLAAVYLLIVVAAVAGCCCCCCLEALEAKQSHKLGRRLFQSKILITAKMLQHSQSALKTQTHNVAALSTQHWRLFILFVFDGDIKKLVPGAGAGAGKGAGAA